VDTGGYVTWLRLTILPDEIRNAAGREDWEEMLYSLELTERAARERKDWEMKNWKRKRP
jgi:hypothetical protein